MTTNNNDNNVTMSEVDDKPIIKPTKSQSVIGKRVRKKNPKYSDSDKSQEFTLPNKNGRPKKKRKLNNGNAQINNLYEKKKDLEIQMIEIQKEIDDVNQKLAIKKAEVTKDEQFNAPTDDEDETLNTKANASYTPTSRGRKSTRGRRKKRGSIIKKATTPRKPTTPKVTPKKVTKPRIVDPVLLPEYTFCRNTLDILMKHRYGFPFNVPVDPVLLKIPDYFLVIKNPMDFGTIRDKLNTQKYNSPCEFIEDVNLVFNNACTYNSPSSDVYIMAETLRKLFKKKIVTFEKKLAEINPNNIKELRKSVDSIGDSFNDVPSDKKELLSPINPDLKPLTKEEKKRLRGHINSLSRYNLTILLNIVQEKITNESAVDSSTQKEVIIDLDSLDTATLRALEKFVNSTLKKKKKKTKATVVHTNDNKPLDGTNDSKDVDEKKENSDSEESESDSEESESESDESDSDDNMDSKENNSNTGIIEPNVDTNTGDNIPKIISAATLLNTKEVNVEKLENAASWTEIANQKEESETITHSPGVANLWSSFRDSHAQVQQKELEKKMHEELLKKEKEKEEEERKRKEEELKQKRIEEQKAEVRKQEEEKLRLEQELEEARLKAKLDREKKVQQDEELVDNTDDLLNSFSTGSIALNMNLSGQIMSDMRSSLKMSSTSIEQTTTTEEEDNKSTE